MQKLTDRQKEVLTFLKSYAKENGMPPTRWEICRNFKWKSSTAAQDHLKRLERAGAIRFLTGKARGIVVL